MHCKNNENAKYAIDNMLKDEKTPNSNLLLAAHARSLNNDFIGAVEIINKVIGQETDIEQKKSLNGSILYYLLKSKQVDKIKEFAQVASKNLSSFKLTKTELENLITCLYSLQVNDLIPDFQEKLNKEDSLNISAEEKIRKLFSENKDDLAIDCAVLEFEKRLKVYVRSLNLDIEPYYNLNFYIFLSEIKDADKEEEFIKKLKENKNSLALAFFYETFEEYDNAIIEYKKVLKLEPNNKFINFKLGMLLLPSKEDVAQKYFKKLSFKTIMTLFNETNKFDKLETGLKFINLLLPKIKNINFIKQDNESFFSRLFDILADENHSQKLPSVFDVISYEDYQKFDKSTQKHLKEREILFLEFTSFCMQKGIAVKQAFAYQYLFKHKQNKAYLDDELFLNAIEAIKNINNNYPQYFHLQTKFKNTPQLEIFVANYAYKNNALSNLKDLKKNLFKERNYYQFFYQVDKLFNASPEEFLNSINYNNTDAFLAAINVINIKNLNINLNPKIKLSSFDYYLSKSKIKIWFKSLAMRDKKEQFIEFSEKILDDILKENIKCVKNKKLKRDNLDSFIRPMSDIIRFLIQVNPKYTKIFIDVSQQKKYQDAINLSSQAHNIYEYIGNDFRELLAQNNSSDNIKFLKDFSCLGSFKDFPFYIPELLYSIHYKLGSKEQDELSKINTFGAKFVLLLIKCQKQSDIFDFLNTQLNTINKCDKQHIKTFCLSLKTFFKNFSITEGTINGKAYLLYLDALKIETTGIFEKLMNREITSESYSYDIKQFAQVANELYLKNNSDKADKLIEHLFDNIIKLDLASTYNVSNYNYINNTVNKEFKSISENNIDFTINLIKYINKLKNSDEIDIYENLKSCFENDIFKLEKQGKTKEEAFCATIKDYNKKLKDIEVLSFFDTIYSC